MQTVLRSLDRAFAAEVTVERPDRFRDLQALLGRGPLIPMGSASSYVAAAFGGGATSIDMTAFNRLVEFDPVAREIEVEAGITLFDLQSFLLKHKLYLPVQPGYPTITVGGAIACDVHGKNQYREGCFSGLVRNVTLLHPDHGQMTLSRQSEPDLFDLTLGGFGLTGIILSARLALDPLPGSAISENRIQVANLDGVISAIQEHKDSFDLLYAWSDLSAGGDRFGRGFLIAGKYVDGGDADWPEEIDRRPLTDRRTIPAFGRLTTPWINRLYHRLEAGRAARKVGLFDYLYPAMARPIYFGMYGRRGFIEHQALVPVEACASFAAALKSAVERHGEPVALTGIKAFRGERRLLRYDGDGISFSLDIPRSARGLELLQALDEIDHAHGAIANLYKDSRLSAATARRQYPEYDSVREELRRFDPARHFRSALSERLEL